MELPERVFHLRMDHRLNEVALARARLGVAHTKAVLYALPPRPPSDTSENAETALRRVGATRDMYEAKERLRTLEVVKVRLETLLDIVENYLDNVKEAVDAFEKEHATQLYEEVERRIGE
jgi:hypothetical protein